MPKEMSNKKAPREKKTAKRGMKFGRPPRPKERAMIEEDSRYTNEVIDALTAYLTFTEEVGLPHGFYLGVSALDNNPEANIQKTIGRIQLPPSILPCHRRRVNNLIELTRLSMDSEPASEFERLYCLAYEHLMNRNDRKQTTEHLIHLVRQEAREVFPILNLHGIKPSRCPAAPFEKLMKSIVDCLDQHILSRREQPPAKTPPQPCRE